MNEELLNEKPRKILIEEIPDLEDDTPIYKDEDKINDDSISILDISGIQITENIAESIERIPEEEEKIMFENFSKLSQFDELD